MTHGGRGHELIQHSQFQRIEACAADAARAGWTRPAEWQDGDSERLLTNYAIKHVGIGRREKDAVGRNRAPDIHPVCGSQVG
jgi:hypothetical protein